MSAALFPSSLPIPKIDVTTLSVASIVNYNTKEPERLGILMSFLAMFILNSDCRTNPNGAWFYSHWSFSGENKIRNFLKYHCPFFYYSFNVISSNFKNYQQRDGERIPSFSDKFLFLRNRNKIRKYSKDIRISLLATLALIETFIERLSRISDKELAKIFGNNLR